MNMASVSIFILILALRCSLASFVYLECPEEIVGQFGKQLVVECVVKPKQERANLQLHSVSWKKGNLSVLSYDDGNIISKNGFNFAEPSWSNMNVNVSLLIANVAVEHEGKYVCDILAASGPATQEINVKVSAKYSKLTTNYTRMKILGESKETLDCSSAGGYPKGELRWFDEENKKYLLGDEMKVEESGGLFKLSKRLTLLPESNSSKYTCMLFNATGFNEYNATVDRPEDPKDPGRINSKELEWAQATKIVPPVVVIGSLIIGLLLLLLMRRHKQSRRSMDTRSEQDLEEQDKMMNV